MYKLHIARKVSLFLLCFIASFATWASGATNLCPYGKTNCPADPGLGTAYNYTPCATGSFAGSCDSSRCGTGSNANILTAKHCQWGCTTAWCYNANVLTIDASLCPGHSVTLVNPTKDTAKLACGK